jgi:hypothetical protein
MKRWKFLLALASATLLTGGWYAFRPERLFINQVVNEQPAPTTGSAAVLLTGEFHGIAHRGTGTATITRGDDGQRWLRFTNFETSNGPDVHVYLVAADDANDAATVTNSGFVALGPLKGNIGDQNYAIPAEVDLDRYRAATIWCKRFGVNFATAPLRPPAP